MDNFHRSPDPISGTITAGGLFGPYKPQLGRQIVVTLTGTFTGTLGVVRSTDGGESAFAITRDNGQGWGFFKDGIPAGMMRMSEGDGLVVNEPIPWVEHEDDAWYYVHASDDFSGSVAYRLAQ